MISLSLDCQGNHTESRARIRNKEPQLTGEHPVIAYLPHQIVCFAMAQPIATLQMSLVAPFGYYEFKVQGGEATKDFPNRDPLFLPFFFFFPTDSLLQHRAGTSGRLVHYLGRCEHWSFLQVPGYCQTVLPAGGRVSVTSWRKKY